MKLSMESVSLGVCEGYNTHTENSLITHEERRYLISRAAVMKYKIYAFHPRTRRNERQYWMLEDIPELDEWNKTISWSHSKEMTFIFGVEPPDEKTVSDVDEVATRISMFYKKMRKLPDGTSTNFFQIAITLDDCANDNISRRYIQKVEELIITLVTKFRVKVYGYFPKDYRCEKRLYHNHTHISDMPPSPVAKTSSVSSPSTEYQVTEEWRSRRKYNMFRFLPGGVGLIYASVDINVNSSNPVTFSRYWSASQIRRLSRIFNKRKMICMDNHPCSEELMKGIRRSSHNNNNEEDGEDEMMEEDRSEDSDVEFDGFKKRLVHLFCHRKKEFGVLRRSRVDFDFWVNLRNTHSRLGDSLWILKLFQLVMDFGSRGSVSSFEYPENEEQQLEIFNAANMERKKFGKLFQK